MIRRIIRAVVGSKGGYRKLVYVAIVVQTSLYSTEEALRRKLQHAAKKATGRDKGLSQVICNWVKQAVGTVP